MHFAFWKDSFSCVFLKWTTMTLTSQENTTPSCDFVPWKEFLWSEKICQSTTYSIHFHVHSCGKSKRSIMLILRKHCTNMTKPSFWDMKISLNWLICPMEYILCTCIFGTRCNICQNCNRVYYIFMNNIVFSVQYSILRKQRHSCFDQDEDIFLLLERERERETDRETERESNFHCTDEHDTNYIYSIFSWM